MKYIFLFLFAVSWQLLPNSSYAQKDTFVIEFKNIPATHFGFPSSFGFNECDPSAYLHSGNINEIYSSKLSLTFDTSYAHGDTIFFGKLLKVIYDSTQRTMNLSLDSSSSNGEMTLSGWVVTSATEMQCSINNIPVKRIGGSLFSSFKSSEIVSHNMSYYNYHINYQWSASGYRLEGCSGDGRYYDGVPNDSSEVTISLATMAFSDVRSAFSHEFKMFPNPASSTISFQFANAKENNVIVFDILGRNILRHTFQADEIATLDISALPPGIYYLRAGNQMQKFVIKR